MVAGHDLPAEHELGLKHSEDVQRKNRNLFSGRIFPNLDPDWDRQDRSQDLVGMRPATNF
jgi:hypothetical protein